MATNATVELQVTVARLAALIGKLKPFLDTDGRCWCWLPHEDQTHRQVLPLRSSRIESWLVFTYQQAHGEFPRYVRHAVAWMEGKLLASRRGVALTPQDPALRCFLAMAREEQLGAGNATEILNALKKRKKLLVRGEQLPANAVAMGVWIRNNVDVAPASDSRTKGGGPVLAPQTSLASASAPSQCGDPAAQRIRRRDGTNHPGPRHCLHHRDLRGG